MYQHGYELAIQYIEFYFNVFLIIQSHIIFTSKILGCSTIIKHNEEG